jgi:hypothetical protein
MHRRFVFYLPARLPSKNGKSIDDLSDPSLPPFVEEAGSSARGEPPRRRPHRHPVAGALQVALPLQVRLQGVARPVL